MNVQRALTFQWSAWTVVVGLLAIAIALALGWMAWRRSGYRRSILWLEGLRLLAVSIAAMLLQQPEWIEQYVPTDKPTVVVMVDDSASMQTRDALRADDTAAPPMTRREAVAPLRNAAAWKSLEDRYEVVVQELRGDGSGTDLLTPLSEAIEKHPRLQGVVLASDGDWNVGGPPVQAAMRMRLQNTPLIAVPVGSPTRLPDIELISIDVPTFGIAGKSILVPVTIESSLPRDAAAQIVLTASDGQELTKDVRIAAMGRTTESIAWKPDAVGDFTLTVRVPVQPDETIQDNNARTVPIAIRQEKLRVLVVESYPRWEYRYLRNALSRDPGVEVSCLLFHPGLSKPGGGNKDYIQRFPEGLDELAQYDVVFIGDVGVSEGQLTEEHCRLLKGLVEQQASGLVFMPGWKGFQATLQETPLADLYPVILDPGQPEGWGSRTPDHFQLTELGRRSLLTKLADTADENIQVWENLPGFQWYAPVQRAKAGSEVLCVHQEVSNAYGRLPLLVTRTFGSGKVLFMGTDGAWRWRKGVEDLYHYRFWGQVVRWMAYQRNMAKGETMRLYYSPDQPQVRQTLTLTANVMEKSGEPLAKGNVVARIQSPQGKVELVRFAGRGDEWGAFSGRFTPQEPGPHRVTLRCEQTNSELETQLFVQGAPLEQSGKPARPEVLEELARVTRGSVIERMQLNQISTFLGQLPQRQPEVRRLQLWSHPLIAGILLVVLAIFWVARKSAGLV
jgi:uncharacterized membrane protein